MLHKHKNSLIVITNFNLFTRIINKRNNIWKNIQRANKDDKGNSESNEGLIKIVQPKVKLFLKF